MLDTKTSNGHSLLSPSSSSRWSQCAGSVRLTMGTKDTTNSMAQRGTYIHLMGEALLTNDPKVIIGVGTTITDNYNKCTTYQDANMVNEARAYSEYVKSLMVNGDEDTLIVESKVEIFPDIDLAGSVDACVISGSTLNVCDLKTGRTPVSAENNSQLLLYAIGLLEDWSVFYEIDTIKLHIIQHNDMVKNTNSWECSVSDLIDFKDWIYERAIAALQEDSECSPSPKACEWCAHANKCKALLNLTMETLTGDFENLDEINPEIVTIDEVVKVLEYKKMITKLISAYENRVLDTLLSGKKVEGYKLVKSDTRKSWVNETEAYEKLKSWMKKDEFDNFLNVKLITPTQAIKTLGKDLSVRKQNIFDTLWENKEGAITFAPVSSKAPEYILPSDEFDDLTEDL